VKEVLLESGQCIILRYNIKHVGSRHATTDAPNSTECSVPPGPIPRYNGDSTIGIYGFDSCWRKASSITVAMSNTFASKPLPPRTVIPNGSVLPFWPV